MLAAVFPPFSLFLLVNIIPVSMGQILSTGRVGGIDTSRMNEGRRKPFWGRGKASRSLTSEGKTVALKNHRCLLADLVGLRENGPLYSRVRLNHDHVKENLLFPVCVPEPLPGVGRPTRRPRGGGATETDGRDCTPPSWGESTLFAGLQAADLARAASTLQMSAPP